MERRCFCRYTPFHQPALLLAGLLWAVPVACGIPDQVQTVPKPDTAKPQQSDAPAAPKSPKKKTSRPPVRQHLGEKANVARASQARLRVRQPAGSTYATPKLSPGATAQNFGGERMRDLERQMWTLINRDRSDPETFAETGGRAQPLNWNERLAEVARAHSRNMLEQGFFAHVDPEGKTLEMRIDKAGIPWWAAGENIAINGTVVRAEARLMNEARFQPNHRYNILSTFFTDVGIGIVQDSDGSLYITQVFIQTPPHRSAFKGAP
jgi:uncharacterized protein YkwD